MLVLLPPSETKRAGGAGPPLAMSALSFPELDPLRKVLVDELVELARRRHREPCGAGALAPAGRRDRPQRRAGGRHRRLPALHRYTGVLYDALDAGSLRGAAAARAAARLMVGSALFGLVRATDPVPAYRLSAGSALPGRPTLAARWRPLLDPVLAALAAERDGGRPALGLVRGARAGAGCGDGERAGASARTASRAVVSHFNKAHKGRLARALAVTRAEPSDAAAVAAVARRAGMRVERSGATHLDVIVAA